MVCHGTVMIILLLENYLECFHSKILNVSFLHILHGGTKLLGRVVLIVTGEVPSKNDSPLTVFTRLWRYCLCASISLEC